MRSRTFENARAKKLHFFFSRGHEKFAEIARGISVCDFVQKWDFFAKTGPGILYGPV